MSRDPGARRRTGLALLIASALAATAACGSTVQQVGGPSAAGADALTIDGSVPGEDGLGGPALGGPAPTGEAGVPLEAADPGPAGALVTGGGSSSDGTPRQPGSPGGTGGPRGTGGTASGAVGPGVTDKTVAIGIPYCSDCASTNAALGAGGEDPGDTRRYYQAAIDEVNARGGVLGRKLVPVFHEFRASDPLDVSSQAACETFTKDNKVLLMFFRGDLMYECGKRAGVVVGSVAGNTGPTYEKYPNVFAPSFVRLERLYEVTVRAMVRARWHVPEPRWPTGKIGLITWESNEYRFAMEKGYLAGLRKAGLEEQDVRYIAVPQNANALADASAAISSAVLAFRQQGIDHVLIGDGPAGIFGGAGLTFLFLSNARSQSYYPRYGFNGNNVPDFSSHPKDQLVGMLAIDDNDTEDANDQGIARNPVRQRCYATMTKRGLPVGQDQTRNIASIACDAVYFTEALLKRATSGTTLPKMIAAGESLGSSYRSPRSFGNRIGPGQHDGAALFRMLRWDEACQCNAYTSEPFEP